jgi:hypothetical protein
LTTVLERDHLNTRRARGRPEKERRRQREVRGLEGVLGQMRAEGEQAQI